MAWNQEKEDMAEKEEELNATIQRLKDAVIQAQKEKSAEETSTGRRSNTHSRNHSAEGKRARNTNSSHTVATNSEREESVQFAPPSSSSSSSSSSPSPPPRNTNNNLLLQKDKIIQQLRLELAEAQIRVAEADHMGGSKVHELEHRLMEVRMTNARLMEDNESFQLLLSTATLNGDFSRGDFMTNAFSDDPTAEDLAKETDDEDDRPRPSSSRKSRSPRGSVSGPSLADELSDVADEETAQEQAEKQEKMEAEIKQLKDQNKALTCYISTIIERLLQHKDFEKILDKTPSLGSIQASQAKEAALAEKALPPPPPAEDKPPVNVLNRTRSMAARVPRLPINKPVPAIPATEDPAPGPGHLQRSQSMRITSSGLRHMRSKSDTGGAYTRGAANLVNPKGPPPRANTFFGTSNTNSNDSYTARMQRNRNSVASNSSIGSGSSMGDEPSTPPHNSGTGPLGMIAGNKLRPLRLVQENVGGGALRSPVLDEEDEKKRGAKRGSW